MLAIQEAATKVKVKTPFAMYFFRKSQHFVPPCYFSIVLLKLA